MSITIPVLSLILAYIAGSIPTAVWAGKIFHNIDIREHGSGNAGATNTIRVLGWKTGIPVLIVDMLKGWAATSLPVFLNAIPDVDNHLLILQIICGMAAIVGHIFPLFAGFRGGKGVATTFGVLLAIQPWVTISCAGVFLVVLLITGYVSVSSMVAGLMFPVFLFTVFETPSILLKVFSVLIALALIITHKKNIKRLVHGEENKFIGKKKSPPSC
jgi:acyl phosphate:glycerol-3-phosphate acyltransferase